MIAQNCGRIARRTAVVRKETHPPTPPPSPPMPTKIGPSLDARSKWVSSTAYRSLNDAPLGASQLSGTSSQCSLPAAAEERLPKSSVRRPPPRRRAGRSSRGGSEGGRAGAAMDGLGTASDGLQLSVTSPLAATLAPLPQSHCGLPAQFARVTHAGVAFRFTVTLVNVRPDAAGMRSQCVSTLMFSLTSIA